MAADTSSAVAPAILELLVVPYRIDVDIGGPSGLASTLVSELGQRILGDQRNCQHAWIGHKIEDPRVRVVMCEYSPGATLEPVHQQQYYSDLLAQTRFKAFFDAESSRVFQTPLTPRSAHAVLADSASQAIEVGIAYHKPDISESQLQRWDEISEWHERENMRPWPGYLTSCGGWVPDLKEHKAHRLTKLWLGLWAWTSIESHKECAARPLWQEVTKPIAGFEPLLDVDMFHVDVVEVHDISAIER